MRRELAAEIEAHIAERADELMEGGLPETEARQTARREFGNPTLYSELGGETWGWPRLERFARDLRYAVRTLRASPLFTTAAVLSLALGIGANAAIFTLLYASLWKPLPVPAPTRIYQLRRYAAEGPWIGESSYSYVLFRELSAAAGGLGEVFAAESVAPRKFSAPGVSGERITGEGVTANFFSALGVEPLLGRVFERRDDSVLGGSRVAVLSHAFWTHRFKADPSILGKTILYDETPYTVVGVVQAGFIGVEAEASVDVWVPATASADKRWLDEPNVQWLRLLVRLDPGVAPARAQALFEKSFRLHVAEKLMPDADAHWRPALEAQHITLRPAAAGLATTGHKFEKPLLFLLVLVAIVLLIACGNVANLILARNSARRNEILIRRALGAGRGRIVSQLLSESLLLSLAGAAGGLILASWGTRLLIAFLPEPSVPLAFDLHPGLVVVAFTAAIAVATTLVFGLVPAWRAGRGEADLSLQAARRVTPASFGGRLLVAGQLALSLLLLIGAGLFAITLRNLESADLGFRPDNVVTFDLSFPKGTSQDHLRQTYTRIKDRLQSHPGTVVASYAWPGIYGRGGWSGGIAVEGRPAAPGEDNDVGMIAAGPGFFEAIGMRLLQGRYLNARDQAGKPAVVVVNESFARHYFVDGPVIGRRITFAGMPKTPLEIVGVVRDARHFGVREKVMRMIYLADWNPQGGSFYVRARAGSTSLAAMIRAGVSAVDKTAQIETIRPLQTAVDDMISEERLTAVLGSAFGALAVVLAAIGLYGVVGYSVSRRTNEFGIRMALGAARGDVRRLVLRQTFVLVLAGVAAGLAAAMALVRILSTVIEGMLYGIHPADSMVFAGAVLLLALVALMAAFLPARRASRIDPMVALRYE